MSLPFHPTASAQQLADVLPLGVAILDQNYQIVSENSRFEVLIPLSYGTFQARCLQTVHCDDAAYVIAAFTQLEKYEGSLKTFRVEYRMRDQDNWCVLIIEPILSGGHNFGLVDHGGFVATIADITPEKKAEVSQRQLLRDAEEHKILQERFIDMISHEIRNPLSAILHCTEDILESVSEEEHKSSTLSRLKQSAETISLCISHQRKILDDVLTFSKIDSSMLVLSPRKVQPKVFFHDPISLFRPQLQKDSIQFDYQCDKSYAETELDWVVADPDRMSQVLINLLSNAVKFTAKSKNARSIRVSIGASIDRPSSYPPNVVFFRSGEAALDLDKTTCPEWGVGEFAYIMLAVKDTGIGIDDETQKRLFERFNQATPRTEGMYGGFGLGLSISRKLCHLHGGEIGVSSQTGLGSTFGFFFRVRKTANHCADGVDAEDISEMDKLSYDNQASVIESYEVDMSDPDTGISSDPSPSDIDEFSRDAPVDERTEHTSYIAEKTIDDTDETNTGGHVVKSILIVEDNIINRQILARKLTDLKFLIFQATNGLEALHIFEESRPDCILMDQEMPLMDGISATKRIRELEWESDNHIPILGVTANARPSQKIDMLDAGMDDVIHKPFRTEEIVRKISQFVPTEARIAIS